MELLQLSPLELAERLGGEGRAKAVYAELRSGRDPFGGDSGDSRDSALTAGARARLAAAASPTAIDVRSIHRAADRTTKALVALADGRAVELVLIPERDRTTLCVSTQVGCARGCTFCLTATMKLVRNLTAAEIAAQVVAAIQLAKREELPRLRNIVFMGMGEPLDNLAEVARSLEVITGEGLGLGFGRRHITVSTVGPSARSVRAARHLPAHLAWSLHAADDRVRRELVPTQRDGVEAVKRAFLEVVRERKEPLFVELTLIDGVNDGDVDADRVVELFRDADGVELRFNLLPMNPIGAEAAGLGPSSAERVAAFEKRLRSAGHFTKIRRARGVEERAACGQLVVLQAALHMKPTPGRT